MLVMRIASRAVIVPVLVIVLKAPWASIPIVFALRLPEFSMMQEPRLRSIPFLPDSIRPALTICAEDPLNSILLSVVVIVPVLNRVSPLPVLRTAISA